MASEFMRSHPSMLDGMLRAEALDPSDPQVLAMLRIAHDGVLLRRYDDQRRDASFRRASASATTAPRRRRRA
jgi:hypothetical protein